LLKMIGVIERCGVVMTEVQGGEIGAPDNRKTLMILGKACLTPIEFKRI
jgi:hypothetical protein